MKRADRATTLALYGAVRRHGLRTVVRACTYLASVSLYLRHEGAPPATQAALWAYWGQSSATGEREARAWREVTGGRDVAEAARAVVSAGVLAEAEQPDDAVAVALMPFVVG